MTNDDELVKIILINRTVLANFFDESKLQGISANSLITQNIPINLPKFEVYKHKQDAADQAAKYDLKRITELAKNESVIYHSLADAIADNLRFDGQSSTSFDNSMSFWSWITHWENWITSGALIAAVLSLIISMGLAHKVKTISATLLIKM